jgi:hypothetical protein
MTPETTYLTPDESNLRGNWIMQKDGSVIADVTEKRIDWLTKHHLEHIATDSSGWEILYHDPCDGRIWELTFPQGEMHGGGPRSLQVLSVDDAAIKYPHAVI